MPFTRSGIRVNRTASTADAAEVNSLLSMFDLWGAAFGLCDKERTWHHFAVNRPGHQKLMVSR